jgi:hypothetical protein
MELAELDMDEQTLAEPEPAADMAFEATTTTEKGKGLAFKYHINTPVNVKRNNSSLIPILQSGLEGLLISVYNYNVNPKNPLHTIGFSNTSGLTLEEGPLSVFIEGVFAGEAMLPFLEPAGECRIPYAVDQGIEIIRKIESTTKNYHAIEVGSREIYRKYFSTWEYRYEIQNYSEDSRRLIIEHARETNVELFESDPPSEQTPTVYRFILDIAKASKGKLIIKQRRVDRTSEEAPYLQVSIVEEWLKAKLITQEEHDYLLDEKVRLIFEEQDRIRQNLQSLKQSSAEKQLRDRYVAKFDERETELEKIEGEQKEIETKITRQQAEISQLEVDRVKFLKARMQKAAKTGDE